MTDSVRLPPAGASVGEARRFVTALLAERGLEHLQDDAALAVSELVTNAVLHARTTIEVRVDVGSDEVRVSVEDDDATLPVMRDYGRHATTGRGLGLVAALARTVGARAVPGGGKEVWFTLPFVPTQPTAEPALPTTAAPGPAPAVEVAVLDGVPVRLWSAARRHEEAALRELALFHGDRLPATLEAWMWFGAAMSAHAHLDGAIERAVAAAGWNAGLGSPLDPATAPPETVRVEVPVTEGLSGRLLQLVQTLTEAERRAASGELLMRPALDEVVALRDWRCRQVVAQTDGAPPTSWAATAEAHGRVAAADSPSVPVPDWDAARVDGAPGGLIALDDRDRVLAVSAAGARLLGRTREDLLGARFSSLLPPALRDGHLAELTRHLTTGDSPFLAADLPVPVLQVDGSERIVVMRFTAELVGGRTVYTAALRAV